MEKIKIDGLEFEVEPILAATIRRAQEAHAANAATLQAKADSLEGERDAAKAAAEELQAKLDAATDPSAISDAVRCRVALEASARKILGDEARMDGKTDREIKVDCLTHRDERFDASDRSDAYIDGRFDLLVETAPERRDSRDSVVRAVASVTSPVSKPAEERIDSADKARLASEKAWRELGRSPLRSARRA